MTFLAASIRVIGSFQAGTAAYLVPHGRREVMGIAFAVGAASFLLNWFIEEVPSPREVLLRGYVAPLAVPTFAFLYFAAPGSWAAAGQATERLLAEVFTRTPVWVYLAGAGFGSYRAHVSIQGGRSFWERNQF